MLALSELTGTVEDDADVENDEDAAYMEFLQSKIVSCVFSRVAKAEQMCPKAEKIAGNKARLDVEGSDDGLSEATDDWEEEVLFTSPLDDLDVYQEFSQMLQRKLSLALARLVLNGPHRAGGKSSTICTALVVKLGRGITECGVTDQPSGASRRRERVNAAGSCLIGDYLYIFLIVTRDQSPYPKQYQLPFASTSVLLRRRQSDS